MSIEIKATHVRKFSCGVCKSPVYYSETQGMIFCKCNPVEAHLSYEQLERGFDVI